MIQVFEIAHLIIAPRYIDSLDSCPCNAAAIASKTVWPNSALRYPISSRVRCTNRMMANADLEVLQADENPL